ncbi:MAG: LuxR C-terminal-related transcriptional regulator [Firmicutes bacterium]|nr:LuxR C-terminal-related transcriptional regulator [Bacillota bacterium]
MRGRENWCLGRTNERRWIQRALSPPQQTRLLLIDGPPGAGKTTLARFAASWATHRGWQVFWARLELTPRGTHWRLSPDLPGFRGWLLGTPASHVRRGGPQAEDHVEKGPSDLSAPPILPTPGLVVLEDVHRADEGTLERLRQLHEGQDPLPLVVLMTARRFPVPSQLRTLRRLLAEDANLSLGPLPEPVLRALAEQQVGGALGPQLKARLSQAAGNPRLVSEFLDLLHRRGLLVFTTRRHPKATSVDIVSDLPRELWEELAERAWDLSAETRHWLKLASAFGSEFGLGALAQLTGRHPAELLILLEESLAAGVLEERGDKLAFGSELYRQALYRSLPAALTAELHREAAEVLKALGAPAEEIGRHIRRAAQSGPQPEAVAWLRKAASELARFSPKEAAGLMAKSVAISSSSQPDFPELLADAAAAWVAAGEIGEAEQLCRQALAHVVDGEQRGRLRRYLIEALVHRCQIGLAAQTLEEAEAELTQGGEQRPSFEAATALVQFLRGETQDLAQEVQRIKAKSLEWGDSVAISRSLLVEALLRERQGDLGAAASLAAQASAYAANSSNRLPPDPLPCSAQAMFLVDLDRFDAAQALLRRQVLPQHGWWPFWRFIVGFSYFWSGAWTQAAREFEVGMDEALRRSIGWRVAARGLYALIRYSRGDRSLAREWIALADAEMAGGDHGYRAGWLTLAKIVIADAEGAVEEAAGWAAHAAQWGEDGGVWATLGPWVIRCMRRDQRAEMGSKVISRLEGLAVRSPTALGLHAALQMVRGLMEDDAVVLEQAAMSYAQAGRPFEQAFACAEAAWSYAYRGAEEQAREHLKTSLGCYRELGASALAARTQDRLAALGVRLTSRRARPTSGWDALTSTELRILRLIAERRTNPEIAQDLAISRRTVETHVSHLLSKLSLDSRWQLAEEAAQHFGWRLALEETSDF